MPIRESIIRAISTTKKVVQNIIVISNSKIINVKAFNKIEIISYKIALIKYENEGQQKR